MKKLFEQKNKAFTRTPKLDVTPKGDGFTLVETLVAISIFTVSILGIMSVLASGISQTSYAKQKMIASYLAQEGIECIRNIRDTYVLYQDSNDWTNFRDMTAGNFTSITCPAIDINSGFTRTLSKDPPLNPDEVRVSSTVIWTQGSGVKSVTFSENLFNWAP